MVQQVTRVHPNHHLQVVLQDQQVLQVPQEPLVKANQAIQAEHQDLQVQQVHLEQQEQVI